MESSENGRFKHTQIGVVGGRGSCIQGFGSHIRKFQPGFGRSQSGSSRTFGGFFKSRSTVDSKRVSTPFERFSRNGIRLQLEVPGRIRGTVETFDQIVRSVGLVGIFRTPRDSPSMR